MTAESYRIYGLIVESELAFAHWPKADSSSLHGTADVTITIGSISREWDARTSNEGWYLVEGGHVFVRIDDVGRFLISNGDSVVFEPGGNSRADAWLYVEGIITGAVLHQRRIWPLHGSAVIKPDGSVAAFVGQRGIGKSTLLFELQSRGCPVVADDIVAIEFDPTGRPMVHPGFPQGKLCLDAVQDFGLDVTKLRLLSNFVRDKFAVTYQSAFVSARQQLSEVFILDRHEQPSLAGRELTGLDKLRQLSDNTYRLELLATDDDYQRLFNNILAASGYVRAIRVCRPTGGNSVRALADFVEGQWNRAL